MRSTLRSRHTLPSFAANIGTWSGRQPGCLREIRFTQILVYRREVELLAARDPCLVGLAQL